VTITGPKFGGQSTPPEIAGNDPANAWPVSAEREQPRKRPVASLAEVADHEPLL
jgi:hypothetical protein